MKKILVGSILLFVLGIVSRAGQFTVTLPTGQFSNWSTLTWNEGGSPGSSDTATVTFSNSFLALTFDQTIALSKLSFIKTATSFGAQINNNVTVTGDIDFAGVAVSFGSERTLTVGGDISNVSGFNPTGGRVHFNGDSPQVLNILNYGDLILSGSGSKSVPGTTGTIEVSDSLICGASTIIVTNDDGGFSTPGTFAVGTSTFQFAKTSGTQNIADIGTFYNVEIAGSGTKQFSGASVIIGNDLTITSSTLQLGLADLTIGGDFVNNSSFVHSNKKVTFDGSSTSAVSGSSSIEFYELEISKSSTSAIVTMSSATQIDEAGTLSFANGTSVLNANGNLELLSTSASNGARIGAIPSGSSITNSLSINRFIPSSSSTKRAWWHISNPVQSVAVSDWQDDVFVTGAFTGNDNATIGGKGATSLYYYNESHISANFDSGWVAFPVATNAETFTNGRGYRIFIRQDTTTTVTNETLKVSGTLIQGDFTFPMSYTNTGNADADGWNFVGNPYPSAIDFGSGSWTKTNVDATAYVWDAKAASYTTLSGAGIIAPMQGFWIQATGAPTLSITENVKTASAFTFKREAKVSDYIEVTLESPKAPDYTQASTEIMFNEFALSTYESGVDAPFLPRSFMIGENVVDIASRSQEGRKLFKNVLPFSSQLTEVPLYTVFTTETEYNIHLIPREFSTSMVVVLLDKYTGIRTLIDGNTTYKFTTDDNPASKASDRFVIQADKVLSTSNIGTNESTFSLYPNPARDQLTIVSRMNEGINEVRITTFSGKEVMNFTLADSKSSFEKTVDVSGFEKGGYLITFVSRNGNFVEKLIVE